MLVIFSKGMTMKDQNCREKKKVKIYTNIVTKSF